MRRFAMACAAIVLLTACADDPEPIEPKSDAPPSKASAQPAPTATPPTMPDVAKRNDATGAANFVLYWVKTFNYAARTGDTGPMREVSPECRPCKGYARRFASLDDRPTRGPWKIESASVVDRAETFEVETDVSVLSEAKLYPLTFIVTKAQPHTVQDIYEREAP